MPHNSLTQWHPNLGEIFLRGAVLLEHLGHQFGMFLVQQEQRAAEQLQSCLFVHSFTLTFRPGPKLLPPANGKQQFAQCHLPEHSPL